MILRIIQPGFCTTFAKKRLKKGHKSMHPLSLKFYFGDSCGHCRRFAKTLEKIEQERANIIVSKIAYNPSQHPDIKFIPTVVVLFGNKELGRFSSALAKKDIDNWLHQLNEYISGYLV
ncbi:thioredoxin family protein [Paenibacillus sp. CAU 1782]